MFVHHIYHSRCIHLFITLRSILILSNFISTFFSSPGGLQTHQSSLLICPPSSISPSLLSIQFSVLSHSLSLYTALWCQRLFLFLTWSLVSRSRSCATLLSIGAFDRWEVGVRANTCVFVRSMANVHIQRALREIFRLLCVCVCVCLPCVYKPK